MSSSRIFRTASALSASNIIPEPTSFFWSEWIDSGDVSAPPIPDNHRHGQYSSTKTFKIEVRTTTLTKDTLLSQYAHPLELKVPNSESPCVDSVQWTVSIGQV